MLFSPVRVGGLELANRIVLTAHGIRLAAAHAPTERDIAYYVERARGGVGLIVQEAIRVHPTTVPGPGAIVGYDPAVGPALRRLVEAVHACGTPIVAQVCHQGRQASSRYTRLPLWAPSAIPGSFNHETPHAMTTEEIRTIVDAHAASTRNLIEAGYDGIEIHAGHGYLLQQFLSPMSNRRGDSYGGSLENRARLLCEVVAAVRAACGDAVLGLRVSAEEFVPEGLHVDEARLAVALAAAPGTLDYVSVSQCSYERASLAAMVPDMHTQPAAYVHLAREVKEAVPDLPVLAVGRINTPELAERVLRECGVDLVGMTRANLADPELPRKARDGHVRRIRPCVALNVCWRSAVAWGLPITCAVNPVAGRETEWGDGRLPRAHTPRSVVVAGGGPAGLEAARLLAEAGHGVTLVERDGALGGQLRLAAMPPGRQALAAWLDWVVREIDTAGVTVRLDTVATAELIGEAAPDGVVVATGSAPSTGDLEVGDGARVLTARDVLASALELPGRVLVVDREWEWQAPAIAEHLAEQGASVTVTTEKLHLGVNVPPNSLPTMFARLDQRGIAVHSLLRVTRADPDGVSGEHVYAGTPRVLGRFDAIVVAGDSVANDTLEAALGDHVVVVAGDCVAPRQLADAIHDAHVAARGLAARW